MTGLQKQRPPRKVGARECGKEAKVHQAWQKARQGEGSEVSTEVWNDGSRPTFVVEAHAAFRSGSSPVPQPACVSLEAGGGDGGRNKDHR